MNVAFTQSCLELGLTLNILDTKWKRQKCRYHLNLCSIASSKSNNNILSPCNVIYYNIKLYYDMFHNCFVVMKYQNSSCPYIVYRVISLHKAFCVRYLMIYSILVHLQPPILISPVFWSSSSL